VRPSPLPLSRRRGEKTGPGKPRPYDTERGKDRKAGAWQRAPTGRGELTPPPAPPRLRRGEGDRKTGKCRAGQASAPTGRRTGNGCNGVGADGHYHEIEGERGVPVQQNGSRERVRSEHVELRKAGARRGEARSRKSSYCFGSLTGKAPPSQIINRVIPVPPVPPRSWREIPIMPI
jgi:hypothetical protein